MLFESGFRHVVVQTATHARSLPLLDMTNVPEWLEVRETLGDSSIRIFDVSPRDRARTPRKVCRQIEAPAWTVVNTP